MKVVEPKSINSLPDRRECSLLNYFEHSMLNYFDLRSSATFSLWTIYYLKQCCLATCWSWSSAFQSPSLYCYTIMISIIINTYLQYIICLKHYPQHHIHLNTSIIVIEYHIQSQHQHHHHLIFRSRQQISITIFVSISINIISI